MLDHVPLLHKRHHQAKRPVARQDDAAKLVDVEMEECAPGVDVFAEAL
jgi:hypothetical protein